MSVFGLAIVTIFAVAMEPGPTTHLPVEVDTVIKGGFVFDTTTRSFLRNTGIAIRGQRFVGVGAGQEYTASKVVQLGDDDFLLPGLIDCHAHYNVRLLGKRREEYQVMPVVYLANGATVTFSCGEFDPDAMQALRKRIETGEQIGPRLLNSGPYFGRARPGWRTPPSEEAIREEVDYWQKQGVGGFKAKSIDPASLRVLIDQAHKYGLTVTGHLDSGYRNSVNPRDAIEMGIDRIEHFLGGDAMPATKSAYASLAQIKSGTPEYKKIVELFIDKGVCFDATLTAYGYLGIKYGVREEYNYWIDETQFFTKHFQTNYISKLEPAQGMDIYQQIYDAKIKTVAEFHRAGGKLTLGTDHVSNGTHLPGFGVHREMDAFVRSGIPAEDVLVIATLNGARALGIEADHGSIAVGKFADLVVVKGNPLENIRNTRNVVTVFKQGKSFQSSELLHSVKGKLGPADAEQEDAW